MLNRNIETFLCCDASFEEADTVLFGAPFDCTTSYRPGTRFGSAAIRHESYGLESYSPYQDRDLLDALVFDSGDLELPFGSPERALADIEERASLILQAGKRPFLLGGEHLVTLGAVRAAVNIADDMLKQQGSTENLRRQRKGYLDEAGKAQSEVSELKREVFRLQQRLDNRK